MVAWEVHNEGGGRRVLVTKTMPGTLWLDALKDAPADFYLALGSAAGLAALTATLVSWLLFTSPRRRKRK